jgi:acetyl esterase
LLFVESERNLTEAGVNVTSTRYNGAIHDFGLLNPIEKVPVVRSALLDAAAELKTHLK